MSNRVYREKVGGAVQVMPGKEAAASPDSKPSWMEEFSRKKANRKSGIFSDTTEKETETAASPVTDNKSATVAKSPDKPAPPKAETKPSLTPKPAEVKPEDTGDAKKLSSVKEKAGQAGKSKTEDGERGGRGGSVVSQQRPGLAEPRRSSELVRHSSELGRQTGDKKHSDLARKHSDSSRHSDKTDKPAVHSTNLGKPDKFSFAKPEKPAVVDKVVSKNEKNSLKSDGFQIDSETKPVKSENFIGWRQDILENNKVTTVDNILAASRETNGYNEKENITAASSVSNKEVNWTTGPACSCLLFG